MNTDTLLGGRYRLGARIATGGMGAVWEGQDDVLGRPVAIKMLHVGYAGNPTFLARFRAEARNTAALSHPGIAQVHDYGEDGGCPYLVMERVPGEPLSALLARERRLDADRTLSIVAQAASALQAAHDAGVVHRDVKPGNVLVTPDGTVKITDFGIARAAAAAPLTATGIVLGTAHYLSPEQAAGSPATPASDVYSLGIVTYQCLAGRLPFPGDNAIMVAYALIHDTPPPLPHDIPDPVRDLVSAMLAKDPSARPAGAAAVAELATSIRWVSADAITEPVVTSAQTEPTVPLDSAPAPRRGSRRSPGHGAPSAPTRSSTRLSARLPAMRVGDDTTASPTSTPTTRTGMPAASSSTNGYSPVEVSTAGPGTPTRRGHRGRRGGSRRTRSRTARRLRRRRWLETLVALVAFVALGALVAAAMLSGSSTASRDSSPGVPSENTAKPPGPDSPESPASGIESLPAGPDSPESPASGIESLPDSQAGGAHAGNEDDGKPGRGRKGKPHDDD